MDENTATYNIKTSVYEGPFDVLISLIESRKLFINDISLSKITDDFIKFIKMEGNFNLDLSSYFLSIASTLLLIKSRSLLPGIKLSTEEEKDISDLEDRLKKYEKYRVLSLSIKNIFNKNILHNPLERERIKNFRPSKDLNKEKINFTISNFIFENKKVEKKLQEIKIKRVINLEEMMNKLVDRITKEMTLSFKEINKNSVDRVDRIINFLAILELVKRGVALAEQKDQKDDIMITSNNIKVPAYN